MDENQITRRGGYTSNNYIPPINTNPGCWENIGKAFLIAIVATLTSLLIGC